MLGNPKAGNSVGRTKPVITRTPSLHCSTLHAAFGRPTLRGGTTCRCCERLADLLAALGATRLDLLRLRAGQGTPDHITHTMTAARELGDDIERLLSARAEIDAALRVSCWADHRIADELANDNRHNSRPIDLSTLDAGD
jgi:hypothetical protein